jgi:hypothetical protein
VIYKGIEAQASTKYKLFGSGRVKREDHLISPKLHSRQSDAILQATRSSKQSSPSPKISCFQGVIKEVVKQVIHLWGYCSSVLWKPAVSLSHLEL